MNLLKRAFYKSCVLAVRAYQRVFLDLHVWGREHIPQGPKIFVMNHITALDPIYLLPVFPEPIHIVIGPPYKFKLPGMLYDAYDQINAMPQYRATVVDESVKRLKQGKSILIAPEADLQDEPSLGSFYPGVAKIYRRFPAPIIPIALVAPTHRLREYPFPTVVEGRVYRCVVTLRGPYLINIGKPLMPTCPDGVGDEEKNEAILRCIRDRLVSLIEDARSRKYWLS